MTKKKTWSYKKNVLTGKIRVSQRNIEALGEDIVENRIDLNRAILYCSHCQEWYLASNFAKAKNKDRPGYRYNRDYYCNGCMSKRAKNKKNNKPTATHEEYNSHAKIYWAGRQEKLREKYDRKPRRIPKEYHKSRYYTKTKNRLKDMTPSEEKEIMTQLKENYEEKLALIEEMGLPVVRKDQQSITFLADDPKKVAKKLLKYRETTKADPKLNDLDDFKREKELKKRKHITKYGVANALGLTVNQLDNIIGADVDESDKIMIQGMIIGVLGEHNDYVSNLVLDNNAGAVKYLEKFGDKDNWDGGDGGEGDTLNINKEAMENVINHLFATKVIDDSKKDTDYIDVN